MYIRGRCIPKVNSTIHQIVIFSTFWTGSVSTKTHFKLQHLLVLASLFFNAYLQQLTKIIIWWIALSLKKIEYSDGILLLNLHICSIYTIMYIYIDTSMLIVICNIQIRRSYYTQSKQPSFI